MTKGALEAVEVLILESSARGDLLSGHKLANQAIHVLARQAGEGARSFVARVRARVGALRPAKRIAAVSYVLDGARGCRRLRARLLPGLLASLEAGAVLNLIGTGLGQADTMACLDSLRPLLKAGVSLNAVL